MKPNFTFYIFCFLNVNEEKKRNNWFKKTHSTEIMLIKSKEFDLHHIVIIIDAL